MTARRFVPLAVLLYACAPVGGGGGSTTIITVPDTGIPQGEDASTPEADAETGADAGTETDGVAPAADAGADPDAGPAGCVTDGTYGLLAEPTAPVQAAHSPRAVWTGEAWGVSWLSPHLEEAGLSRVMFQRFDGRGEPLGEPVEVGAARLPQHQVLFTGSGFVVVWLAAPVGGVGGPSGIAIQPLGGTGAPLGGPLNVLQTADVTLFDAAWAPLGGGMVAFTRGRDGDGLWVVKLDEGGQPGVPVHVYSDSAADAPAITFGDAYWGLAWLDAESSPPADVLFTIIDDEGALQAQVNRATGAGARGRVDVAYGGLVYAVGWSRNDAAGNLTPQISLYDSLALLQGSDAIPGPEGFALVTDVAWLTPGTFGVAWQDNAGGRLSVGMTRLSAAGQVFDPLRLDPEEGGALQSLHLAGNVTRVGGWYVDDPEPPRTGGFSEGVQLRLALFGPCP